jgi:signal transduction histidine kinase/CheY-like chemotaxis protein
MPRRRPIGRSSTSAAASADAPRPEQEAFLLEQRFAALASLVSDAVWLLDRDGLLHVPSASFGALTGQAAADQLGEGWCNAVPAHERAETVRALRRYVAEGAPFTFSCAFTDATNTARMTSTRGMPVAGSRDVVLVTRAEDWRSESGEVAHIPRAATEEDEASSSAEMIRLAERVQQAEQRAARAERMKEELIAVLGHELRNPLAPIVTALELLALKDETGSMTAERGVIHRQVQHLVSLVDDLLDISRLMRGRLDLRIRCTELAPIVVRAIDAVSPALEEKRHRLSVKVPPEGLAIMADPERAAQIIAHLLDNAAKYTAPCGHIEVMASRTGDRAVISVRDDGTGIAPDLMPHLFEMFARGVRTLDRQPGGLGIGLTITKNLVGLHGGSIHVESGPWGSVFTVELPAAETRTSSLPAPSAAKPRAAANDADALRVLVVDDNLDAANGMTEALSLCGYNAKQAYDGPRALALAREFMPHCVLLDIGLPVMDGYAVAEELRKTPELEHAKLIVISGYGHDADPFRSSALGIDAHLVKPVALDELRHVLQRVAARQNRLST